MYLYFPAHYPFSVQQLFLLVAIILAHIVVYSIPPLLGSFTEASRQLNLNYTYLGVLFTLVQLFDRLYAIRLSSSYSLYGGDIAYSALIFATFYLISLQPKPKVVRNLIYLFVVTMVLLFLLFGLINIVLNSDLVINDLDISDTFLEFSFFSLLLSLSLFSIEIMLGLWIIQRFLSEVKNPWLMSICFTLIFVLILLLDGVLYPLGINLLFPGSAISVANGIVGKVIFGLGFGTVLIVLLSIRPHCLPTIFQSSSSILDYLVPRSVILRRQLVEAEEKIEQLVKILPICMSCKSIRDDEGYWQELEVFMKRQKDMMFSHGFCPKCADEYLETSE